MKYIYTLCILKSNTRLINDIYIKYNVKILFIIVHLITEHFFSKILLVFNNHYYRLLVLIKTLLNCITGNILTFRILLYYKSQMNRFNCFLLLFLFIIIQSRLTLWLSCWTVRFSAPSHRFYSTRIASKIFSH